MAVHMYFAGRFARQKYIANYFGCMCTTICCGSRRRRYRQPAPRATIRCASGSTPTRRRAGLDHDDIVNALRNHNVQVAAGSVGQPPQNRARAPSSSMSRRWAG